MKNLTQNSGNTSQGIPQLRKSQKHEVNLQRNSVLYFQIGLILCLLGVFALLEMKFEHKILKPETAEIDTAIIDYQMDVVKVYEPEAKKMIEKQSTKLIDTYIEKQDIIDAPDTESVITPEQTAHTNKPIDPGKITLVEVPDDIIHVDAVQFVPVFPGCEKFDLNSERKKCLNDGMTKLVQKKFDTNIASEYGLSGIQRIFVEFKVDSSGEITDIKTRAPHPKLDDEANRIAHKIPKMQPGKMGTTPVSVIYNLPITFKVQN